MSDIHVHVAQQPVYERKKRTPIVVLTKACEQILWERNILSMSESLGLSRAVYFYFCKAFGVFSRNALRELRREQFWFGEDEIGKYVGFVDTDEAAGTNNSEPTRRVRHYDDPSNDYSVYKIMSTYMLYIPPIGEFFRRPLYPTKECQKPIQYSGSPVGINTLSHYIPDMMRDAGFEEHFTPQSIKCYVVSIFFQAGIDEELTRQRTRWWIPSRISLNQALDRPPHAFPPEQSDPGVQSLPQKLLTISKLLDPPTFSPSRDNSFESQSSSSEVSLRTLVGQPDAVPSGQYLPKQPQSQQQHKSAHFNQEQVHSVEYKWFSGGSSHSTDSDCEEYSSKRPRIDSPPKTSADRSSGANRGFKYGAMHDSSTVPISISKSPPVVIIKDELDESDCCVVGSVHPGFVASSGPVLGNTSSPAQISRSPAIKEKAVIESSDSCVVGSVYEVSYSRSEQQTNNITSSNRAATSSTSSRKEKTHPSGVKNQMQCLSNSEMKEASSRPPKEGTSSLSFAFKFAYEIDHNGEVAANREVRAMHATINEDSPNSSVKRRLLPLNLVDSSGQDAAERQADLPNFTLKLSDFFPSISRQQIDIMDVVIRGTRGEGTDRLNVELVVAERDEQLPE